MESSIKVMGVEVKYSIPANLSELVALPGASEELIYNLALKQVLYHSSYGAIRAAVSDLLEKQGHGARKSFLGTKEVTVGEKTVGEGDEAKVVKIWLDEKGKEVKEDKVDDIITETDLDFFRRVCAEQSVEPSQFTSLVQEAATATPFDVTRKERSSGKPKKAAKTYIKIATEIFDAGAEANVASQLSSTLGIEIDITGDRDEAINTLALAIGANEKKDAEARKSKYMAMS